MRRESGPSRPPARVHGAALVSPGRRGARPAASPGRRDRRARSGGRPRVRGGARRSQGRRRPAPAGRSRAPPVPPSLRAPARRRGRADRRRGATGGRSSSGTEVTSAGTGRVAASLRTLASRGPRPTMTSWIRLAWRQRRIPSITTSSRFSRASRPTARTRYLPSSRAGRRTLPGAKSGAMPLEITSVATPRPRRQLRRGRTRSGRPPAPPSRRRR